MHRTPGKVGTPVSISTKIQPTPHISSDPEYSVDPNKTSGGLYHNVTTSCEYVCDGTDFALAKPKSASFNSPISLMRRFCGFTSRCKTLLWWQYARPRKSWKRKSFTFLASRPPPPLPYLSMYCERSVCTYSNTKVKVSRVWIISWRVTMLLCLSSFRRLASRMAVNGAPSSSWSLISFNATTWLVRWLKPLNTVAYEPSPNCSSFM